MDVTINQERFSSADVNITFFGRPIQGLVQIDWKEAQDVEEVYVVGNRAPVGNTRGNWKYEGEMVLLREELLALQVAAKGSIMNLPAFPITITMVKDGLVIKETLQGVIFKENANSAQGGSVSALQARLPFKFFEYKLYA